MAILKETESSTVRAIDAARVAAHTNWDSIGISMSALGSECDRELWFNLRWASQAEVLTGQKLRLFETGHSQEARMIADLRLIEGVEVRDIDPETGKQYKVYAVGGHVRGKLDGEADGLPEAPKTTHVVEAKSHNDKNFKELVKKKLKASKPAHYWQCQIYMNRRSLTRCLYIAVNKNNDELYSERIEHDPVACMKMLARLESIILRPDAPSRISDDPKSFACIFCNHKAVCHHVDFGRNHCRSCIHSTPIVDHDSTDATWLCEKWNRTLSVDEQRAGCHAHLFHPAFVPGKQADAGDDFVAYAMADGSEWVDRVQPAPEVVAEPEPTIRYWHHAESGIAFADANDPGHCEELTAAEYADASAYYAAKGIQQ